MTQQLLYRNFSLAGNAEEFLSRNGLIYKPGFPQSQFCSANLKIHDYPLKPSPEHKEKLNGFPPPDRGVLERL